MLETGESSCEISPNIFYIHNPDDISEVYSLSTTDKQRLIFEGIKDTPVIPELSQPNFDTWPYAYEEGTFQEVLFPLVNAHDVIIVAGGFFGDEGKGKTIDAVARHPQCKVIARTNSGENAGHTVINMKTKEKFVFHLIPSGALLDGRRNFIGPECVMDPVSFCENELMPLIKSGITYKDRLFVGNVHIVTPYHKLIDMLTSSPNSSTLKGMSPSHASKITKRGIRLDHLFNDPEITRKRLNQDMETYLGILKLHNLSDEDVKKKIDQEQCDGVQRVPNYCTEFALAKDKVEFIIQLYNKWVVKNPDFPSRCDVPAEMRKVLAEGGKILLEGPQSYWLSNAREKFWGSSTSSDTSAAGMLASAQINFQKYKSFVINVHKTPGTSRVGIGANASGYVPQDYFSAQGIRTLRALPDKICEDFSAIQKSWCDAVCPNGIIKPVEYFDANLKVPININVAIAIASSKHHGECGATTLKPRVCGVFDCVSFFEVNDVQGPYITISALDRGDDYDKIGVAIAYVYYDPNETVVTCNEKAYKNYDLIKVGDHYPSEAVLFNCYPIVKLIDSWSHEGKKLCAKERKAGEPLPRGLQELIATIEHFTKAVVISIGNGLQSDNIIYIRRLTGKKLK